MTALRSDEPLGLEVTGAIRRGDLRALESLLRNHERLAQAVVECRGGDGTVEGRSLLHVVTDWPGHFPNGSSTVALLVEYGANVNARFIGSHHETPLHWAASTDDVEVLDTLLDCGADIEADGAVIAGGTPLADAVAFGQWRAARRLIERGARTTLWQAAALGLMERVVTELELAPGPSAAEVTRAFWAACHGGQVRTAACLLERGANLNWVGYDGLTPLDAARRSGADDVAQWLLGAGATSANGTR